MPYLIFHSELADFGTRPPVPGSVSALTIRSHEVLVVDGTDGKIPEVFFVQPNLLARLSRKQSDLGPHLFNIVSKTGNNLFLLEMLDPRDLAFDLEAVQQRAGIDVPQMDSAIVTPCEDKGRHDLQGGQLLVVVVQSDHVLHLAQTPVLLPQ